MKLITINVDRDELAMIVDGVETLDPDDPIAQERRAWLLEYLWARQPKEGE